MCGLLAGHPTEDVEGPCDPAVSPETRGGGGGVRSHRGTDDLQTGTTGNRLFSSFN